MRRLIINADDFGLTTGVNRAIIEAHDEGIVTSSTLMSCGLAFDEAVRLAKSASGLSIGCHVVLVDGTPQLGGKAVPSLVGPRDGQFDTSLASFALRVIRGIVDSNELEAEITAQIRKLQTAGITVSHLDAHKHTHVLPSVLVPLLRAARACGVRAVRNPFGPLRFSLLAGRPRLWKQFSKVTLVQAMAGKFRRTAAEAGIQTTDGTVGIVATGCLDHSLFRHIVETLPDGTWEFVCHPGYNDADLQRIRTRLHESRVQELRVLISPEIRALLAKNAIQLISYRDLA